MLDHDLRPLLLEVNHAPSFATDSVLDYEIKRQLLRDTFTLLGLTLDRKQTKLAEALKDKKSKVYTRLTKDQKAERNRQLLQELAQQDEALESQVMDFVRVFPIAQDPTAPDYFSQKKRFDFFQDMLTMALKYEHSINLRSLQRQEAQKKAEKDREAKEERRKEKRKQFERKNFIKFQAKTQYPPQGGAAKSSPRESRDETVEEKKQSSTFLQRLDEEN